MTQHNFQELYGQYERI